MIKRDKSGQMTLGPFEYFIQIIIVLSLVDFAIGTLPDLSEIQRWWVDAFELFSIVIFTVEYLIRAFGSRPFSKYVFGFSGIIDLLAIVPFFLGLGIDLRSLRALRLLRLLRILKLARYSSAIKRFHRAFLISKEELVLFGITSAILLFLAAVGIYYFENPVQPEVFSSVFDGLWWAVSTLTTVGYGDSYPITVGGRIFTFFVLTIGLGLVAIPTGLIASALSEARCQEHAENHE